MSFGVATGVAKAVNAMAASTRRGALKSMLSDKSVGRLERFEDRWWLQW
jgi:hypothetical protein